MFRKGEKIGGGDRKNIYEDADNPKMVIAECYADVESARHFKSAYYLQKLLRCFFPDKFPDTDIASYADKPRMRVQKLNTDSGHREYVASRVIRGNKPVGSFDVQKTNQFLDKISKDRDVYDFYMELSRLGFILDDAYSNFSYDADTDNRFYYLDISCAWSYHEDKIYPYYDIEKLRVGISEIKDTVAKRNAEKYLERIEQLRAEEEQELKEGKKGN